MAGKWIQGAIKHPGALTRKAKRAKMSPMAYAEKHKHDSGETGRQSRFALVLRKINRNRSHHSYPAPARMS